MEELFKNLTKVLSDFGPRIIEGYRNQLAANKHNATGNLSSSVSYTVEWKGSLIELSLSLEDYWKYVESGTRPHFPPTSAILSWIRAKHIAPKPMRNGKLPTEKQLAFLIARKISRDGTKGTNDLENIESNSWDNLLDLVDNALEQDISDNLDEILEILWK